MFSTKYTYSIASNLKNLNRDDGLLVSTGKNGSSFLGGTQRRDHVSTLKNEGNR